MTIGNAISLIKLAIPLGLLLGLLWFRHDARTAHLAFDKLKAEYIADSQAAAIRQVASNQALEAHWKAKAEGVDRDYQTSLQGALRRAGAYSATHACSVRPPAERASRAADTVPVAEGPGGDNRSDPAPIMVAVSAEDVNICTTNTARLEAAQAWARGL